MALDHLCSRVMTARAEVPQMMCSLGSCDAKHDDTDLEDVPLKAPVSSAYVRPKEGLNAQHLSKVWSIDLPSTAKRTRLEVTTQHQVQTDDVKLARNYGTDYRMLRYKRVHRYFFMDTFFASKKHGPSSRKNTCCQLAICDGHWLCVCRAHDLKC